MLSKHQANAKAQNKNEITKASVEKIQEDKKKTEQITNPSLIRAY